MPPLRQSLLLTLARGAQLQEPPPARLGALEIAAGVGLAATSGSALLAHTFAAIPLSFTVTFVSLPATLLLGAVVLLRWRLHARLRFLASCVARGAGWGLVGTLGYDVVRPLIVWAFGFPFTPFAAIPAFGHFMTGRPVDDPIALTAGWAYHFWNGVSFGVMLAIAWPRAGWLPGVLWGCGLQVLMNLTYPQMLGLRLNTPGFLFTGFVGHGVWGLVLGHGLRHGMAGVRAQLGQAAHLLHLTRLLCVAGWVALALFAFTPSASADNCSDPPNGPDCQGTVGHATGIQAGAGGVAVGVGVMTAAMAANLLGIIQEIARNRGYDDIWKATLYGEGKAYNPDGSINIAYVQGLRENLERRIGRDLIPDDGRPKDPFTDFVTGTWNDVRHSTLIRIGVGILSGGSTEMFYQSQAAYEAIQRSFEDAMRRGRDWDLTDALRAGYGAMAKENLPTNLIEALNDPKATWKDIALAGGMDIFAINGLRETFGNVRGGLQGIKNGDVMGGLTHREPIDFFGTGGKEVPPRPDPGDLTNLPEGWLVKPNEFGIPEMNGRAAQMIADKHGVNIDVRPTNLDALERLAQGDLPKPMDIESKSITPEDMYIGAPPGEGGRVAYFEPQRPDMSRVPPELQGKVEARYQERLREFNDLRGDMNALQQSGKVRVENGIVIDNTTGKRFTGDHDVFNITDARTGQPVSPQTYNQIVDELKKPPFNAQHGAHRQWEYNPAGDHGSTYQHVDETIQNTHRPGADGGGGKPLISFGPERPPSATYHHGGGDYGKPPEWDRHGWDRPAQVGPPVKLGRPALWFERTRH